MWCPAEYLDSTALLFLLLHSSRTGINFPPEPQDFPSNKSLSRPDQSFRRYIYKNAPGTSTIPCVAASPEYRQVLLQFSAVHNVTQPHGNGGAILFFTTLIFVRLPIISSPTLILDQLDEYRLEAARKTKPRPSLCLAVTVGDES